MIDKGFSVHFLRISDDTSGQRVDNFLRVYLKDIPRSMIYRIIRIGGIRINKKRVKFHYRLQTGDIVKIPPISGLRRVRSIPVFRESEMLFLKSTIIYEDDFLLILNKPSGVSVHGGSRIQFNVIDGLRALRPTGQFLELVHRLDKDTSGVLLIAKNRPVLTCLHKQLRFFKIQKEYLALVCGIWNIDTTVISVPLFKKKSSHYYKNINIVYTDSKNGKFSKTYFRIKECLSNIATFLVITPITGRTHQIRVHTQYAEHPIIGDRIYGNNHINIYFEKYGLNRLFLHAYALRFIHPYTKKYLYVRAPLDQSFQDCLLFLRNIIVHSANDDLGKHLYK